MPRNLSLIVLIAFHFQLFREEEERSHQSSGLILHFVTTAVFGGSVCGVFLQCIRSFTRDLKACGSYFIRWNNKVNALNRYLMI